ncbi:dihydrofolate reductase [Loigolactobacillus bifermentans]|uniref:Dihydrofolate reductase n=1 Tax=Loigolactobacillus bifermentans DSM 20003 TaxID=1423726 RepID=A0A0R1GPB0_9LACO|nr:dihydrofolate reductase [Loigolactobacillus bifermentans]KRK34259.1 dihydrofolate reductase [Loigolactobacillus bifermentans DSM 20003]QGG59370.1 dihydrofolate reductase [Loigolactobacillus bifermentans]
MALKQLAYIWAEDQAHTIGLNGQLPWHLPADMHYFKTTTQDNLVIMGRRTFASFGGRPLPQRVNIVLTHQMDFKAPENVIVCHTKADVLQTAAQYPDQIPFIIGGATLYELFKQDVQLLYVTRIQTRVTGDTKMPALDWTAFQLQQQQTYLADDKNRYAYTFECYQRK